MKLVVPNGIPGPDTIRIVPSNSTNMLSDVVIKVYKHPSCSVDLLFEIMFSGLWMRHLRNAESSRRLVSPADYRILRERHPEICDYSVGYESQWLAWLCVTEASRCPENVLGSVSTQPPSIRMWLNYFLQITVVRKYRRVTRWIFPRSGT
jgi:hypothetical protein